MATLRKMILETKASLNSSITSQTLNLKVPSVIPSEFKGNQAAVDKNTEITFIGQGHKYDLLMKNKRAKVTKLVTSHLAEKVMKLHLLELARRSQFLVLQTKVDLKKVKIILIPNILQVVTTRS
jgi:hypothetical protein